MAFINTRDIIGDKETVDALVEHSLTELKENSVYRAEDSAFRKNNSIKNVEFPNAIFIGANCFRDCTSLESVKIGGGETQSSVDVRVLAFKNARKLKKLIIDRPNVSNIAKITAFMSSAIGDRNGAIYVPENLISEYKASTLAKYFHVYNITRVNDEIDFDNTIEDNWETILSNPNYDRDYNIVDTKTMTLSNGDSVVMQIIAFDKDVKADGLGKAKITWLCKYIYDYHQMLQEDDTTGGWPNTTMRSWLHDEVLPMIPSEIRNKIVTVAKNYKTYDSNTIKTSNDKIWIPSVSEVGLSPLYMNRDLSGEGTCYSDFFRYVSASNDSDEDVTKCKYDPRVGLDYTQWILRSVYDKWCYCYVSSTGINSYGGAKQSYAGTVFGFCTD